MPMVTGVSGPNGADQHTVEQPAPTTPLSRQNSNGLPLRNGGPPPSPPPESPEPSPPRSRPLMATVVDGHDDADDDDGHSHPHRDGEQDLKESVDGQEEDDEDGEVDDFAAGGIRHAKSHRIASYGLHEDDAGGPPSRSRARIRTYTDDARTRLFPRLSKPLELMHSSYDCVVIGSGYGGAVAASRMARARSGQGGRRSVCVLERGRERWPGEYPSGLTECFDSCMCRASLRRGCCRATW